MKENNSLTNKYIAHIEDARYKMIGVANALSLNDQSHNHIIRAINVINKILHLGEERILTVNELAFLDTIIGVTSISSTPIVTQERIILHLNHYNELVNELGSLLYLVLYHAEV